VIILAVQTIKGTGMIKDGQIFVTIFRSIGNGVKRITTSCTCWTDEVPHTIGGKGIIVVGEVPFMRPSPLDLAVLDSSKATKAPLTCRYPASMYA